jgi:hypothetical protein
MARMAPLLLIIREEVHDKAQEGPFWTNNKGGGECVTVKKSE